jgi:phage FluMu gp28-like protein
MSLQENMELIRSTLYPYQRSLLDSPSKRIIVLKARRTGMSYGAMLRVLVKTLLHKQDYFVVTTSLAISQTLLSYVTDRWAPALKMAGYPLEISGQGKGHIEFKGGGAIVAKSSNLTGLRGLTGSVLIDEIAFLSQKEQALLFEAILPLSEDVHNPHTELLAISTPWVADPLNAFYQIWTDPTGEFDDFERIKLPITEAVKQGLPFNLDLLNRMSPARRDREFMTTFLEGGGDRWFDRNRLQGWVDPSLPEPQELYLGIDLGSQSDRTAIVAMDTYREALGPVWEISGVPYNEQLVIVSNLIDELQPRRVHIDSTRNETFRDIIKEKYPSIVEGISFTYGWKKSTVEALDKALHEGSLKFRSQGYEWYQGRWVPSYQNILVEDFSLVVQKETPSGLVTFDTLHDSRGHGDSFAAALLAFDAASSSSQEVKVKSGSTRKGQRRIRA